MNKRISLQVKSREKKQKQVSIRSAIDYEEETIDPDFCRWAFGVEADDPVFFSGEELVDAWNKRHKEELTLSLDGNIGEDMAIMEKIWQMNGYPNGIRKN